MAISEDQATNFVNRVRDGYPGFESVVQTAQRTATAVSQETTAWGGAAAITAAIPDATWNTLYPFTKTEFGSILANYGDAQDVLGTHGDLKPNLTKLRE